MVKVCVLGSDGMIGQALLKRLEISKVEYIGATRSDVDLTDYESTIDYIRCNAPDIIILAAAKVGGGKAISSNPTEFLETNLAIQTNVMKAARELDIKKLILLASSALYPADAVNPIVESSIFKGKLDPVQESYGLAKAVGLYQANYYNKQHKMNFLTVIINNVIGNKDNGQVVYSLIKQMMQAKHNGDDSIVLWGSGEQRREFIFADDVARAIILLMDNYNELEFSEFNIGVQYDISIKDLAYLIKEVVNYQGRIVFDKDKPEGVKKRVLDSSRLFDVGFKPSTTLREGITDIYENLQ